ncbi:hypothetical protein CP967_15555 [Streptomyces nitrosporeus]|uniref:Uncharacterized protein n=1 Tax=Streptomyces nitrosporeus TaxID=28894 RepID=A0A5J6FE79_9ACTN|nr:hypothetical protein [Streptomyces nitrosporeus]QEU73235.1 hypothetical protein CP967_15555 [Streptomyces nitrosporeus]GGZ09539.1 hypothetical protein GCM10010327_45080 [Streptomyces nitrosporeus]
MGDALPLLVLVGALGAVMGLFTWLAVHVRRRGSAGAGVTAALAAYDEAFRVTAHEAHHEIQAQADRRAPLTSPDGLRERRREVPGRRPGGRQRVRRPARGPWRSLRRLRRAR